MTLGWWPCRWGHITALAPLSSHHECFLANSVSLWDEDSFPIGRPKWLWVGLVIGAVIRWWGRYSSGKWRLLGAALVSPLAQIPGAWARCFPSRVLLRGLRSPSWPNFYLRVPQVPLHAENAKQMNAPVKIFDCVEIHRNSSVKPTYTLRGRRC